jgi:hypothetical protein
MKLVGLSGFKEIVEKMICGMLKFIRKVNLIPIAMFVMALFGPNSGATNNANNDVELILFSCFTYIHT